MHLGDSALHSVPGEKETYSHRCVSGQLQSHVLLFQVGVQARCGCRDDGSATSRYHSRGTARAWGQCCRLGLGDLCLCEGDSAGDGQTGGGGGGGGGGGDYYHNKTNLCSTSYHSKVIIK